MAFDYRTAYLNCMKNQGKLQSDTLNPLQDQLKRCHDDEKSCRLRLEEIGKERLSVAAATKEIDKKINREPKKIPTPTVPPTGSSGPYAIAYIGLFAIGFAIGSSK